MDPVEWCGTAGSEAQHDRALDGSNGRGGQCSGFRLFGAVCDEARHEQFLTVLEYPIRLVSCSGSLCTAVRGGSNGTSCHELRIDEQLLPEPDERAQCFGRGLFRDQLLNQMSD